VAAPDGAFLGFAALFAPSRTSSASRARTVLWLLFHYLEGAPGPVPNPFADARAPGVPPPLRADAAPGTANRDTHEELAWAARMRTVRAQYLQGLVHEEHPPPEPPARKRKAESARRPRAEERAPPPPPPSAPEAHPRPSMLKCACRPRARAGAGADAHGPRRAGHEPPHGSGERVRRRGRHVRYTLGLRCVRGRVAFGAVGSSGCGTEQRLVVLQRLLMQPQSPQMGVAR
jgi:hypothetical protein